MCSRKENQTGLQENGRKLTISQLRKHKGFENIDDTEAEMIIDSLYELSLICFSIYKSKINNKNNGPECV